MDHVEPDEGVVRSFLEAAPDALLLLDAEGRIVLANAQVEALFGYPRDEIVGKPVDSLLEEPAREAHARRHAEFRAHPSTRAMGRGDAFPARRRDGSEILVEVNLGPVRTAAGEYVAVSVREVSERRRMEEALRRSEERLRAVLEQCPVGILFMSPRGDVELNERGTAILGSSGLRELPDGTPLRLEDAPGRRALRGERTEPTELVTVRSDGTRVPLLVRGAPLLGPEGEVQGGVVAFEDITVEKELERLRKEWTSVVAHDLQQPVAAIRLYAGLLDRVAARDAEAREPVAKIVEISRALDRMIADLLDLSRAEVGQLPLWRRPVDLTRLVRTAVERAAPAAGDRAIAVHTRGAIPTVTADPDRVLQVLENLLGNAVKYGAPGTPIVVTVERTAGDVAVAVTDQGAGIAPGDLPRLFHRFERGGAVRDAVKGAGLGLHIARELVAAHGGHLTAASEPGAETTFRFTLPLDVA